MTRVFLMWDVADPMNWTDVLAFSVIAAGWVIFAVASVWKWPRSS